MAKKKQEGLQYLQMPLPAGQKSYVTTKIDWAGLSMRRTVDTGMLSDEMNLSTDEAPYLTPSQKRIPFDDLQYVYPIGMFGFDNFLIVIYKNDGKIMLDYIQNDPQDKNAHIIHTGIVQDSVPDNMDVGVLRSIVKFNVYDTPQDPVDGSYIQRLLIFPDKRAMPFHIAYTENEPDTNEGFDTGIMYWRYNTTHQKVYYVWDGGDWKVSGSDGMFAIDVLTGVPNIQYAAVHLSRLFGVDKDRIYASGFNDYANWDLDTADEYNANNAWASPAQSNTKSNGAFTGITVFQNHVVCFKEDYMHEIYNNKNPFRIQDIFAEGAMDIRTVQDVDGTLFFVGGNHVKIYTGGNPRIVDYNLDFGKIGSAAAGTDGQKYYLYCRTDKLGNAMFVYDKRTGYWAREEIGCEVVSFAHNKYGMFLLGAGADGKYRIYRMDTGTYAQKWYVETDLSLGKTVDIKRIKKIQFFADLAPGSQMQVYLLKNGEKFSEDAAQLICERENQTAVQVTIPIRVLARMTANYGSRIRICGNGYVKVYQMEMVTTKGGALYAGDDI